MAAPQVVPAVSPHPSYATLGARITAYFIDLLILLCMLLLVAVAMRTLRAMAIWSPAMGAEITPEQQWRSLGVRAKLLAVGAWVLASGPLYFILFEAAPWQATLGKRLLRIRVTDDAGRRITLARSSKRWFARWLSTFFGGPLVSLVTIALSKKRLAVHDGFARTLVLRGPPPAAESIEPWRFICGLVVADLLIIAIFLLTM